MEPETWLALAAFFGTSGTALCIVLVKYKFRRNSNSIIPTTAPPDCVDGDACDGKMEAQEKLFESKIKTVDTKLDGVVKMQDEHGKQLTSQSQQLTAISQTTNDILSRVSK